MYDITKYLIVDFRILRDKNVQRILYTTLLFKLLLFILFKQYTLVPDSVMFIDLGKKLVFFNLDGYNGERSPGYPLLIYFAFTLNYLVVIYQFVIGSFTSVIWFKLMKNLRFKSSTSFLFSIIFSTLVHVFLYETAILSETITLFLISVLSLCLSKDYLQKRSFAYDVFIGVLLAYLVLIKPFYIFIPVVIFGFYIIKRTHLQNFNFSKVLIIMLPMISFLGWSYVNKLNTGYFVSTVYFGLNKAQNCVYFAEKTTPEYRWISQPYVKHRDLALRENRDVAMSIWFAHNAGEYASKNLSFADFSNELGKFADVTIKNNFTDYLHQVITKSWFDFWRVYDMKQHAKFSNSTIDSVVASIWLVQKNILYIIKLIYLALTPFYIIQFLRNRKITFEVISVTIILFCSILQGIVTYGTNSKYSFPFEFLMVVVVLLFLRRINYFAKL